MEDWQAFLLMCFTFAVYGQCLLWWDRQWQRRRMRKKQMKYMHHVSIQFKHSVISFASICDTEEEALEQIKQDLDDYALARLQGRA